MKFPRTIRLDTSDVYVFKQAAEPGEWALSGSFVFHGRDPGTLDAKEQLAFKNGWLGTKTFGHASLVEIAEIEESELAQVIERLAQHFVAHLGAPALAAALPVARQEADDAAGLCEHPLNTLLAVERDWTDEGIVERFRVIRPERATDHAKIWQIVEEEE